MRPLAHRIRNDSVNANHGQKQCKCREHAQQHEYEPATLQRLRDDLVLQNRSGIGWLEMQMRFFGFRYS